MSGGLTPCRQLRPSSPSFGWASGAQLNLEKCVRHTCLSGRRAGFTGDREPVLRRFGQE